MIIVVATGGFDPIHSGHIQYLKSARQLGDLLIVGLNSDEWLVRKKGRAFMPFTERHAVLSELRFIAQVLSIDDSDGTAADAIRQCRDIYPDAVIVFANGGDRTMGNVPEQDIFSSDSGVLFEFGVGGDYKLNSSSWILDQWQHPKTERTWGEYRVLKEYRDNLNNVTVKLKELVVKPHSSLSMQRHQARSEHWFVALGEASVYTRNSDREIFSAKYNTWDHIHVPIDQWHRLANESDTDLHMIEIQYGFNCTEEDIERQND